MLAEEAGRRRWRASRGMLRPIDRKVNYAEKSVKSELDISKRMTLDVFDERRKETTGAAQLFRKRAVGGRGAANRS